jgi:hypothetical protein
VMILVEYNHLISPHSNFLTDRIGSWSPPAAPLSENAPNITYHLRPESAYFLAVNRNKRSITVNFTLEIRRYGTWLSGL